MSDATRHAILGILNKKKMSGYQIKKELEKTIRTFWTDSFAQLYPMLHQLEKNKLIELDSYQSRGKRVSKIYSITTAGKNDLKEWLKQPASELRVRDELLLKVFMGANVEESFTLAKINKEESRLNELSSSLCGLKAESSQARKDGKQCPLDGSSSCLKVETHNEAFSCKECPFYQLTIDYIEGVVNAKLN